jgi:hypothetical protein
MHHTNKYQIGSTWVLTNPYGYHHHEENRMFDKDKFVDFEGELNVAEVSEH